ncbi:ammonium transporter [Persicirhabdus sediminis]|uniref:Ammonium transporter n=1 Tax=Persicirhabdus sediminis TaxID=454144 RepID=A0A8J7MDC9_9BACT|nr:ammonium transporter [Persicirhabdus sediminis]MBK1790505.1 ammonium transporter [Persicirhabdus sediminis]
MKQHLTLLGALVCFFLLSISSNAAAGDIQSAQSAVGPSTEQLESDLNTTFVLISAALVFFMQAGFCLLELGCVRAKNCLNVVMKNAVDFCIAMICFLFVGFGLMFGATAMGLLGTEITWLSTFNGDSQLWVFWIFQAVFVATAATITSGAMAERTTFIGYCAYTVLISGIIYPILGHWSWGSFAGDYAPGFGGTSGWLESLGFSDFAGSTVVHSIGGACALAGVLVIGPRKGRFAKNGDPLLISGHNIPLVALGTFILCFGWFGFNCGSNLAAGNEIGRIAVNTMVAAASGGLLGLAAFWIRDGRPEPLSTMNGILGGLVAITACCNVVTPASAVIIGAIAGVVSTLGSELLLKFKIDDVVGAIPVHLFNGIWGTLSVALFNEAGFAGKQLGVQALGAFSTSIAAFVAAFIGFKIIHATIGLRASEEEEEDGLDFSEHASNAYPDFRSE